jgi:hypothetical protein
VLLTDLSKGTTKFHNRILDFIQSIPELVIFQCHDDTAAATREPGFVTEPGDTLAVLISTPRTGDIDLAVVQRAFEHDASPHPEETVERVTNREASRP